MEIRRAADAFLRSNASAPLSTLLTPSLTTARCCNALALSNRRNLSSTPKRSVVRPQTTTAATPSPSEDTKDGNVDAVAKSLGWTSLTADRSRISPSLNRGTKDTRARAMDGGNSANDLLSALNEKRSGRRASHGFDITRMQDPNQSAFSKTGSNTRALDLMRGGSDHEMGPPKPAKIPLRLNATTGRSVTLGGNIDIGRGIRLLEQSCARNRVRRDFTKQRFHERGGLRRKRIKKEGWRRRFAEGFSATVGRVKQLKNQGW